MGDALLHPLPFFFIIAINYCFFFHSVKLTKDREIKRKIASKRLAKFPSMKHMAKNYETLQPSDTKGTEEMQHLTATTLELKFTALKPSFSVKPKSLSGSCEKAGRQTSAFPR